MLTCYSNISHEEQCLFFLGGSTELGSSPLVEGAVSRSEDLQTGCACLNPAKMNEGVLFVSVHASLYPVRPDQRLPA